MSLSSSCVSGVSEDHSGLDSIVMTLRLSISNFHAFHAFHALMKAFVFMTFIAGRLSGRVVCSWSKNLWPKCLIGGRRRVYTPANSKHSQDRWRGGGQDMYQNIMTNHTQFATLSRRAIWSWTGPKTNWCQNDKACRKTHWLTGNRLKHWRGGGKAASKDSKQNCHHNWSHMFHIPMYFELESKQARKQTHSV